MKLNTIKFLTKLASRFCYLVGTKYYNKELKRKIIMICRKDIYAGNFVIFTDGKKFDMSLTSTLMDNLEF